MSEPTLTLRGALLAAVLLLPACGPARGAVDPAWTAALLSHDQRVESCLAQAKTADRTLRGTIEVQATLESGRLAAKVAAGSIGAPVRASIQACLDASPVAADLQGVRGPQVSARAWSVEPDPDPVVDLAVAPEVAPAPPVVVAGGEQLEDGLGGCDLPKGAWSVSVVTDGAGAVSEVVGVRATRGADLEAEADECVRSVVGDLVFDAPASQFEYAVTRIRAR